MPIDMHGQSVVAGLTVFVGYNVANAFLVFWFYQVRTCVMNWWRFMATVNIQPGHPGINHKYRLPYLRAQSM